MTRIMELAREQAFVKHAHYALMKNTQGHVQGMSDKEWGFSACPHPDCVLVRADAAASLPQKSGVAWLVGLGSMPPQWWTGRGDEFTTEVDGTRLNPTRCAMRFARREDAERAIGWLVKEGMRDGCRAEEHAWL